MALSSSIHSPLSTLAKPLSRFRYSRFPQSYSFTLLHFLHDYSNPHSHTVTYSGTHTHGRILTDSLLTSLASPFYIPAAAVGVCHKGMHCSLYPSSRLG